MLLRVYPVAAQTFCDVVDRPPGAIARGPVIAAILDGVCFLGMMIVLKSKRPRHLAWGVCFAFLLGLGCRDSNPNYLIQNQASYR